MKVGCDLFILASGVVVGWDKVVRLGHVERDGRVQSARQDAHNMHAQ